MLQNGWRFHADDNPDFARPDYDDRHWQSIDPTRPIQELAPIQQAGIGWLRIHLKPAPNFQTNALLQVYQMVASEIYLNGRLIQRYGVLTADPGTCEAYQPSGEPIAFSLSDKAESVLAVRVAYCPLLSPHFPAPLSYSAFSARITTIPQVAHFYRNRIALVCINLIPSALLLILGLIHFTFFYHNRSQYVNLYFAIYTVLFAIGYLIGALPFFFPRVFFQELLFIVGFSLSIVGFGFNAVAHYGLFSFRRGFFFYLIMACGVLSLFMAHAPDNPLKWIGGPVIWVLFSAELLRVTILALRKHRPAAGVVVTGHALQVLFLILFINVYTLPLPSGIDPSYVGSLLFSLSAISVPMALSLFLAREFAKISQLLAVKLLEVETMSVQSIAHEKEKQWLLATQNETLEAQVSTRTAELKDSLHQLKIRQDQLVQREKLASLGELTAGIAHEIQNPLNLVNNFAEVSVELSDELNQAMQQVPLNTAFVAELAIDLGQNAGHIARNGKRASGIVKSMLEHSRSSTGERQPTNLNALAEEYLHLAYQGMVAQVPGFSAQLHTDFASDLNEIELVPQDIGRVLQNLFYNAFYAVEKRNEQNETTYQPQVWVSTSVSDSQVSLMVRDNGTGIPPDLIAKIYQPFFTTKPTGQGTGLGLSISYDIVTKGHAGQLLVDSEEGKYTSFTIILPI